MSKEAIWRIREGKRTGAAVLDLSNLRLIEVPVEISQLSHLIWLDLSGNHLATLPAEICQLTQLTGLDLSGNQLANLPTEICQLSQLTELNLIENQLATLPAEIGQLSQLTELNLIENHLATLPAEIGQLSHLTTLRLWGNHLVALPAEIGQLSQLTEFYLSGNQLATLPAEISQLAQLTRLDLSGNQLVTLPIEISQLSQLTKLDLSGNQLVSLPIEISQLTQLTWLDLSGNQLVTLPIEISQLTQLTWLDLRGNPLSFPPRAILDKGIKTILSFLQEHQRGQREEWRSKIILVGEGGVGKTSLLKQLLGEPFDVAEETTHGLQIRNLEMAHPQNKQTMQLNAWDFGGQHILHATHQFFLTQRSLYILVWNARQGHKLGKLSYWLDMIQARDPEAPVLIVAAHAEEWQPDFPYHELCNKYPMIKDRYTVSNRDRAQTTESFTELKEQIRRVAAALPLMGTTWPKSWLDTAEWVRKHGDKHTSPVKLYKAMRERGVDAQETLADYLHDLGDILYFRDNEKLDDLVILDATWVAQHISRALASPLIKTGRAILTKTMMKKIWSDVDEHARDLFLRLMEEFDLSYKTEDDEEKSIVVEKLSADEPDYRIEWDKKEGEPEVAMIYRLEGSLPPGIPTWFIARSHRYTTHTHWRYGALLAETSTRDHLALIRANDHERKLELRVRGPYPHNYFALLKDGLELTLNRYPGLKVKRKIPCPCPGTAPCKEEFDYGRLLERLGHKETIECHESAKDIPVRQLLFGITERTHEAVAERYKDTAVLDELRSLREMMQREFLKQNRVEQEKMSEDKPGLYLMWPEEQNLFTRINELGGKTVSVQLICEAPGCWHQPATGGTYQIKYQAQWQKPYQPVFEKLVDALKLAAPLLTAATGLANSQLKGSLKFMEELGKPEGEQYDSDSGDRQDTNFLREVLAGKDEKGYGLRRMLSNEGHIYWVCEAHYQQYQKAGRFTPL